MIRIDQEDWDWDAWSDQRPSRPLYVLLLGNRGVPDGSRSTEQASLVWVWGCCLGTEGVQSSENLGEVPRIWEVEGHWRSEMPNPVNDDYRVLLFRSLARGMATFSRDDWSRPRNIDILEKSSFSPRDSHSVSRVRALGRGRRRARGGRPGRPRRAGRPGSDPARRPWRRPSSRRSSGTSLTPTRGLQFSDFYRCFTDFSDFLGRLHPRQT